MASTESDEVEVTEISPSSTLSSTDLRSQLYPDHPATTTVTIVDVSSQRASVRSRMERNYPLNFVRGANSRKGQQRKVRRKREEVVVVMEEEEMAGEASLEVPAKTAATERLIESPRVKNFSLVVSKCSRPKTNSNSTTEKKKNVCGASKRKISTPLHRVRREEIVPATSESDGRATSPEIPLQDADSFLPQGNEQPSMPRKKMRRLVFDDSDNDNNDDDDL